jgi:hypothetical protein
MSIEVKNYGRNLGVSFDEGKAAISFEIMGMDQSQEIAEETANYNRFIVLGDRINLQGYIVATHGSDNNLPGEVKDYHKYNPILPEILKKQVRIMYGHGPGLYQTDDTGEKPTRKWVTSKYPQVLNWLDSWKKDADLDSFPDYIKRVGHEYYYMEGYYSHRFFNVSRRIDGGKMPIRGLKAHNGRLCRLATTKEIDYRNRILDTDCDIVLVGDWSKINLYQLDAWPRHDPSNPFKYSSCINYIRDRGFDEDIYSQPTTHYGLKGWVKGSNLNASYINSYLENSFNAKVHVIIPDAWIKEKETTLRSICEQNEKRKAKNEKLIEVYEGIDIAVTEFSYDLLTKLINKKIADATQVLSGSGKNQGKAFWSRSFLTEHGIEKWEFSDIPSKYAEFVKSILDYNKESTKMILAGKGLDPAISNVGNEGVFNSGSQVYYSYLVYLDTLGYAEEYVTEDINQVLWINFPELARDRVKLGFMRFAPEKQQETTPNNRIDSQPK